MAVKVVTDSTSYIPEHLKRELDISTVSLNISFETENYKEEEIDNATFYNKMSRSSKIPTSSQPSLKDICERFESIVSNGDSVIGIFLSSEMSGTYSTALLAKDMILERYPQAVIEVVDSRSNCMELGFAAIAAARAAGDGKSMDVVLQKTKDVMKKSRFLFAPDMLDYLKKGGRIGGAAALLGNILQIKPILTVVDGKTEVYSKVRTKARAIEKIVDIFLKDIKDKGLGDIIVHHINDELKGKELAALIEKKIGRAVPVYSIGPVIGLHVGPGAVGVVYYTNK